MSGINLAAISADLKAVEGIRPGRACRVRELVDAHPEPEVEKTVREAIADLRYSHATVARVLTKNGLPISEGSVRKHRRGECSTCGAL